MKCPHCKKVPYPAFEYGPDNKLDYKKPIYKNWFKVDMMTLLFLLSLILILFGFKVITDECNTIISDPCEAVKSYNCLYNVETQNDYTIYNLSVIKKGDIN